MAKDWVDRELAKARRRLDRQGHRGSGNGHFSEKLSDGTTIFGPESTEGRPGHKHGHRGSNFHRSPHSTIGSAAIGQPHNYETHKAKKTRRW